MHPRTREILDHLDGRRAALEHAVQEVPATLREVRPGEDRWSVAEILEHLGLVEEKITRLLQVNLDKARELGPEEETTPVMPMLDLSMVLDRSRPNQAAPANQPTAGLTAAEAWTILTERRRALRQAVIEADGYALGAVTHSHALFGDLNLYQWLLFLGGHEARHTAQVRETGGIVLNAASPPAVTQD